MRFLTKTNFTRMHKVILIMGVLLGKGEAQYVQTSPSTSQTVTQPVNTTLNVVTSGTGSLQANGITAGNINSCIWVDGTHYAQTDAGIQLAVNAAGTGGCVYLPPATYSLTATSGQEILITQSINFICAGWGANLQLASGIGNTVPVILVQPTSSGIVNLRIQDCQITPLSGTPGSYGIEVDAGAGTAGVVKMRLEHNYIGQFGTGGIYLNNSAGEVDGGIIDSTITDNFIYGGISGVTIGDSNIIENNIILGTPNWVSSGFRLPAMIDVNFKPGASKLRIKGNNLIPLSGCAIHLGGGDGVSTASSYSGEISGNEIEVSGGVGGCDGALVDLDGASTSSVINEVIDKNSFQVVGGSTLKGLRINYANETFVGDGNSFELGALPAVDVVVTANALRTQIKSNQWNGVTSAQAVNDLGVGTTFNWGDSLADPTAFQDNTGTGYFFGATGLALRATVGENDLYDGSASPKVAAVFNDSPSNTPASGTYLSAYNGYVANVLNIGPTTNTAENFCIGNGSSGCTASIASSGNAIVNQITATSVAATGAFGAWTTTIPTPGCTSGSLTTASSTINESVVGRTVNLAVSIIDTNNGSCVGALTLAMDFTAQTDGVLACREVLVTGDSGSGLLSAGTSTMVFYTYNNGTFAANGRQISCSGVIQKTP